MGNEKKLKSNNSLPTYPQPYVKAYVCNKNERSRCGYKGYSRHYGTYRSRINAEHLY